MLLFYLRFTTVLLARQCVSVGVGRGGVRAARERVPVEVVAAVAAFDSRLDAAMAQVVLARAVASPLKIGTATWTVRDKPRPTALPCRKPPDRTPF